MTALWLRSIRRRPHTVVLLCLLSTVAVLTSVLGPLLVRAVHQSTLTAALADAGLEGRSVTVSSDAPAGEPYDVAGVPVLDSVAGLSSEDAADLWQPPQLIVRSGTIVIWKHGDVATGTEAQLYALADGCQAYRVTAGECPVVKGQVMISSVDAERQRLRIGDEIEFGLAGSGDAALAVVGFYDAAASAESAGLIRPSSSQGVLAGIKGDPLVTPAEQAAELPLPFVVTARATLQPGTTLAELPALLRSIETTRAAVNSQDRLVAFVSAVPDTLARVDSQARSAQILILVTGVQALFLAIFALTVVLQRVGRARAAEWGVGRLRGVPRARWLGSIYLEPLIALLLGLPLGYLAGVAVGRGAVAWALRPDTPVDPWRWPVVGSALAATAIAVAALVAVSVRSLRQPLADLVQQQAEARRLGVAGAVAHAGVFLLAAATLYQLVSGGLLSASSGQLGLLAPGLLALAVAMLAVRGAVLAVRRITTRPPRSLAALVVGRHAARSPSILNPAMIIAVGVSLTVFATQVLALSVRNQGLRADADTGASRVLTVSVPRGGDLLTAVRAADPTGQYAMAVADNAVGEFSGPARVVAVDAERLAAVSAWSAEWAGVADLAAKLRGTTTPPIVLRGTEISVDLAGVGVAEQPRTATADAPPPPPELVATVETADGWQTVGLGRLRRSEQPADQRLTGQLPCTDGCRLVALGLRAPADQPYEASFTVTGIGTDRQPAAESHDWLRTPGRWREQSVNQTVPDQTANIIPRPEPAGLAVQAFDRTGSGLTSMSPTDTVDPMPALLAPDTTVEQVPGQEDVGYGTGLDGQQQKLTIVGRASILPRALADGVLVDLTNARGLSDPAGSQTVEQVWLAPGAPADLERRLAEQGLRVAARESLTENRAALESQATTRGAAVAVAISAAALLLSLLALVAARWSDAGRRTADWRALREGGVTPRRLRMLVAVEIAVPGVLAVLVGLLSGAVAVTLAAPRLPLVDLARPGPPLELGLQWWPIGLIGAGTVLAVLLIGAAGALAEIRPRRLR